MHAFQGKIQAGNTKLTRVEHDAKSVLRKPRATPSQIATKTPERPRVNSGGCGPRVDVDVVYT